MKVTAIIQARMGSTRLPGKAMMPIEGMPMLWHVVNRVKNSKKIDDIVIATTTKDDDDKIMEFCDKNSIKYFRGSEEDVLGRYYKAAVESKADVIVRITSDCPLIDPEVTDRVVAEYLSNKNVCCGASNVIKRTYPRGLDTEVLSFGVLEEINNKAKEPMDREHVTRYIYNNSKEYPMLSIESEVNYSKFRWTVDEKEDMDLIRKIYSYLYGSEKMFFMYDILKLYESHPELLNINSTVKQIV